MSAYTKAHLDWLKDPAKSFLSPLAVISHVDLDAFYAQCQQVRLGLTKHDPVVCRQWNGLIAISYAARRYGIGRHETAMSAREKCKDIIFAHVATFKKGETEWKYHDNPRKETDKVSLDPFRRESRKIFEVFKEFCSVLEKASIDETYFDLGGVVHAKIMEYFPALAELQSGDALPDPPKLRDLPEGLQWFGAVFGAADNAQLGKSVGTALYDFDNTFQETLESNDPELEIRDWDDVCLMIASAHIRTIRAAVLDRLDYTCSAGIARNKILAKLASSRYKPARQTAVRAHMVPQFLDGFEFTDVGGLGGKMGEEIKQQLEVPEKGSIAYLRNMPKDQMLKKVSPGVAARLIKIIHGEEAAAVNTRTDIKSMMATKNFTDSPLATLQDAQAWLKVYAAELHGRIMELSESKTHITLYPKTVTLTFKGKHHASHNKQAPFPAQVKPDKLCDTLYELGYATLKQINGAFPCSLLALGASNFQDNSVLKTNSTLSSFFTVKPKEAKEIKQDAKPVNTDNLDEPEDLYNYEDEDDDSGLFVGSNSSASTTTSKPLTLTCETCHEPIPLANLPEHRDFHFAQELHRAERQLKPAAAPTVTAGTEPFKRQTLKLTKAPPKTVKRMSGTMVAAGGRGKKQKIDKNQTFLTFGKKP